MCNDKCKICRLRAATEVTGNDTDIKREFERIEQAKDVHLKPSPKQKPRQL